MWCDCLPEGIEQLLDDDCFPAKSFSWQLRHKMEKNIYLDIYLER